VRLPSSLHRNLPSRHILLSCLVPKPTRTHAHTHAPANPFSAIPRSHTLSASRGGGHTDELQLLEPPTPLTIVASHLRPRRFIRSCAHRPIRATERARQDQTRSDEADAQRTSRACLSVFVLFATCSTPDSRPLSRLHCRECAAQLYGVHPHRHILSNCAGSQGCELEQDQRPYPDDLGLLRNLTVTRPRRIGRPWALQ
jgi:hypothetical protein